MRMTDSHVYFFGKGDPFSNWTPSPMRVALAPGTRPVEFACGEQLFMAWKALHFASYATLDAIVREPDPKAAKALGRDVKPFDTAEWHRASPRYMFKVAIAKYSQDPVLHAALLRAGGRRFVEASPYDDLWGVKLGQDDPRVLDESQWLGRNWLGLVHDMAYRFFYVRERRLAEGGNAPVDQAEFFDPSAFSGTRVEAATAVPTPPRRTVPGRRP